MGGSGAFVTHLNGAAFAQSLTQPQALVVTETVKELLALRGSLPPAHFAVDLAPGSSPLPQTTSQVVNIFLCPVAIAWSKKTTVVMTEQVNIIIIEH